MSMNENKLKEENLKLKEELLKLERELEKANGRCESLMNYMDLNFNVKL